MKKHSFTMMYAVGTALSIVAAAGSAHAQQTSSFEYAAKVVCGVQPDPKGLRLAAGVYATTVNIHNPSDGVAEFTKKLALTFPPEEQAPGKIFPLTPQGPDKLEPDQALKVDCEEIVRR